MNKAFWRSKRLGRAIRIEVFTVGVLLLANSAGMTGPSLGSCFCTC